MRAFPKTFFLALLRGVVVLLAVLLRLQHEAFRFYDVEEEISHQIGIRRISHLQTRPESGMERQQQPLVRYQYI